MPLPQLLSVIESLGELRELLLEMPSPGARCDIGGLQGSSDAVVLAALAQNATQRFFVVVNDDVAGAERWLADLTTLDAKALRESLMSESDPIRKSVAALALEEYAASTATADDNQRPRAWLALARELQQNAFQQFADSSILPKTHPAEVELNRRAVQRLTEPEFYLAQSRTLISELRLNDARQLLDAGVRRHADSIPLREALAQTLIDEADLRPNQSKELIARAIEQLQALTADTTQDPSSSLMKLAGLLERTDDEARAQTLYRQVADRASDPRQRLLARSRLAVLQVRAEAP